MDYKNLEMLFWLVAQFRSAGETGITFDQLNVFSSGGSDGVEAERLTPEYHVS